MKDKNTTKKSLKASGLALMLCIAMLIGTTFAWFTDSITNSGNKIQAGNLDITLEEWDGSQYADVSATPIFNYDQWEPGYTDIAAVKIGNNGSLALKYKVDFITKDSSADTGKLTEVIDVYYLEGGMAPEQMPENFNDLTIKGFKNLGSLSQFLNKEGGAVAGELQPKASDYAMIALHMQENAGNEYQGLSSGNGFDIVLNATQLNSEKDGFGDPDYDKDADANAVFGAEKIKEAMNDPEVKEVVLGEDIDLNKDEFKETNGNCTFVVADGKSLNLNGRSFIRPDGGSGNGLSVKAGTTAQIKNGRILSEGDMATVDVAEGATVTFSKVVFEGHGNELVKARAKAGTTTTMIFKDCTFENAPVNISGRDGATCVDVKFENCTFEGTYMMYGTDGQPLADKYGHIHYTNWFVDVSNYVYGTVDFNHCTMNFDASASNSKRSVIGGTFGLGCSKGETLAITLNNVTITGKNVIPIRVDSRWGKTVQIKESNTTYTVDGKSVKYDGSSV